MFSVLNVKQLADQLWRYDPAHATSPADATRRMAPGGTEADLRMRSSKPAGSSIDVNEEQPMKASLPRLVRPAGSVIDVNEEQSPNAFSPRLVRPAGSAIDVIEEQPAKAPSPRLVRPAGSVIDVIEEQIGRAHV